MPLGDDFRHKDLIEKARRGPRKVRTPAGAKKYGQPIGTVITRDMIAAAGLQIAPGQSALVRGLAGGNKGGAKKPAPAKAPARAAAAKPAARPAAKKPDAPKAPPRKAAAGKPAAKAPAKAAAAPQGKGPEERKKALKGALAQMKAARTKDERRAAWKAYRQALPPAGERDEEMLEIAREIEGVMAARDEGPIDRNRAPRTPEPKKGVQSVRDKVKAKVKEYDRLGADALDRVARAAGLKRGERKAVQRLDMDTAERQRRLGGGAKNADVVAQNRESAKARQEWEQKIAEIKNPDLLEDVMIALGKDTRLKGGDVVDLRADIDRRREALKGGAGDDDDEDFGDLLSTSEYKAEAVKRYESNMKAAQDLDEIDLLASDLEVDDMIDGNVKHRLRLKIAEKRSELRVEKEGRVRDVLDRVGEAQSEEDLLDILDDVAARLDEFGHDTHQLLLGQIEKRQFALNNPIALQVGSEFFDGLGPSPKAAKVKGLAKVKGSDKVGYLNVKKNVHDTDWDKVNEWIEKPDESPAGKAILGGKAVDEIEDPDGLEHFLVAHPERFEINWDVGGGQGNAFEVYDNEAKRWFFFKRASNNGDVEMFGDAVNEYMAAQLGRAAFPDMFPNVDFAERPENGGNPLIRMDHLEEFAKKNGGVDVRFDAKARNPHSKALRDPKNALAIHIFDYLVNQNDRHLENYGHFHKQGGGDVLVPIDNGGAFFGFNNYQRRAKDSKGRQLLDDTFVYNPELVAYDDWAKHLVNHSAQDPFSHEAWVAKGLFIADEVGIAYHKRKKSLGEMEDDANEIIEAFRKVDVDRIIADLLKRFPNMDEYERKHLEAVRVLWTNRLKMIDGRRVADKIGGNG